MADEQQIREKYMKLRPVMTERSRRLWAATEAQALGRGGISAVSRATGISRNTIMRGSKELESPETLAPERIRRPGGGRKPTSVIDPTLMQDLDALIDPMTRGDPESPLPSNSVAVDMQEPPQSGGGTRAQGTPSQPYARGGPAA